MKNDTCKISRLHKLECKLCPIGYECFGACEICGMPLFTGENTLKINDCCFICECCMKNLSAKALKAELLKFVE